MTTATDFVFPPDSEERQWDVSRFPDEDKVPAPKYRHAAPSAPWPWMDFNRDVVDVPPPSPAPHEPCKWSGYPQSLFGNWTKSQLNRCRMLEICKDKNMCQIHKVDVFKDGTFDKPDEQTRIRQIPSNEDTAREFWDDLQSPLDPKFRIRALFVENITTNVLQILGAKYNIEPFFFASSANWIPSRYQEDPKPGEGDHITVVLPFIRTIINQRGTPRPGGIQYLEEGPRPFTDKQKTIDTQAPLVLSTGKVLLQDLLAIHMVRNVKENIVISYHHHSELQRTTAGLLCSLVQRTGDSVYWQKLYKESPDPTFVFLAILWYALYAWDETLEVLYAHLSETLEASTTTMRIAHTRELHQLQAHLLYYQQLLHDFSQSVKFVRDTRNPAMSHRSISKAHRESSEEVLKQESENLLCEIERLEKQRLIQSKRLQNAIHLTFSTINIKDSKRMQRDSATVKQISYLTMIFLPASYLASVFGMNVAEINPGTLESVGKYIVSTVILTAITVWVAIALQGQSPAHKHLHGEKRGIVQRLAWPYFTVCILVQKLVTAARARAATTLGEDSVV